MEHRTRMIFLPRAIHFKCRQLEEMCVHGRFHCIHNNHIWPVSPLRQKSRHSRYPRQNISIVDVIWFRPLFSCTLLTLSIYLFLSFFCARFKPLCVHHTLDYAYNFVAEHRRTISIIRLIEMLAPQIKFPLWHGFAFIFRFLLQMTHQQYSYYST